MSDYGSLDKDALDRWITRDDRLDEDADEALFCLDRHSHTKCAGTIEYRQPLSATDVPFPRCDRHWADRLATQEEIDRRYPKQAPADFDPMDAGERWDEEDY